MSQLSWTRKAQRRLAWMHLLGGTMGVLILMTGAYVAGSDREWFLFFLLDLSAMICTLFALRGLMYLLNESEG